MLPSRDLSPNPIQFDSIRVAVPCLKMALATHPSVRIRIAYEPFYSMVKPRVGGDGTGLTGPTETWRSRGDEGRGGAYTINQSSLCSDSVMWRGENLTRHKTTVRIFSHPRHPPLIIRYSSRFKQSLFSCLFLTQWFDPDSIWWQFWPPKSWFVIWLTRCPLHLSGLYNSLSPSWHPIGARRIMLSNGKLKFCGGNHLWFTRQ